MRTTWMISSLLICLSQSAFADGVSLGTTRIIYPTDKSQVAIRIYNNDKKSNFLVQSWVTDDKGNKVNAFIVTPPIFVLKANTDSVLRVVYSLDKDDLPKDREKIFFFNAKVIPSLSKEEQEINNALLLSTTTRIKLFMRPTNLAVDPYDAYGKIKCSYEDNRIKIDNPTPFYMNMVSIIINGKEISKAETIAPFNSVYIESKLRSDSLHFSIINDYGVQLTNNMCSLKIV